MTKFASELIFNKELGNNICFTLLTLSTLNRIGELMPTKFGFTSLLFNQEQKEKFIEENEFDLDDLLEIYSQSQNNTFDLDCLINIVVN